MLKETLLETDYMTGLIQQFNVSASNYLDVHPIFGLHPIIGLWL